MDNNWLLTLESFFSQNSVFFVGSETDDTVLLAIKPVFDPKTKTLSWFDPQKKRIIEIKSLDLKEETYLEINTKNDSIYIFLPLSLELDNNVLKNKLFDRKEFITNEEMVKYFTEI